MKRLLLASAAMVGALTMIPAAADARGGFHGGGGFRGGYGGGFRGAGFRGGYGGYRGRGYGYGVGGLGLGLGLGLAAGGYYGGYDYPYGGYGYGYAPAAYGYGGCYTVPRVRWTPYGYRRVLVEQCG